MANTSIYQNIATRTGGDIYIGVVGPVRSGKSTFIKRFMENLVIPNISSEFERERANDELPQSASGRTIMTTEPKFIPENGVEISLDSNAELKVRMIDCVGYIVPSSIGYIEDEQPRMVMTPWFEEPIPFNMAAELGTQKVITEHSTVGLVVTTDGSISDIPRDEYEEAEERVIEELKSINKPFVILLNCVYPHSKESKELAEKLTIKYEIPVIPLNCIDLDEAQIVKIISKVLFEFPIKEISLNMPSWVSALSPEHWLRENLQDTVKKSCYKIKKIRDVEIMNEDISCNEFVDICEIDNIELGHGKAEIKVVLNDELFYKVITEKSGLEIANDEELMDCISNLADIKKKYERFIRNFMLRMLL